MKEVLMFEFSLGLAWATTWCVLGCVSALRRLRM